MADVAWAELQVWPWRDEYLDDEELAAEFNELGLTVGSDGLARGRSGEALVGGMNGFVEYVATAEGWFTVKISGEFRGGSYEIREDSDLLALLRERGIAYRVVGDAKYEWDGDEVFWHPGMAEQFAAQYSEAGRVLSGQDYDEMKLLAAPLAARVDRAEKLLDNARNELEKIAVHNARAAESDRNPHLEQTWKDAVGRLEAEVALLRADRPQAVPLIVQLDAFFEADPDWTPPPGYQPQLKISEPA